MKKYIVVKKFISQKAPVGFAYVPKQFFIEFFFCRYIIVHVHVVLLHVCSITSFGCFEQADQ